jgi:hypothetical protein
MERKDGDEVGGTISEGKKNVNPRMSPPLWGVVRYNGAGMLPSKYAAQQNKARAQGKITPRNMGIKEWGNRRDQSYKELLIQNLLREYKLRVISPKKKINHFFKEFKELYPDKITSNPVKFPGFRDAIEEAKEKGKVPGGVGTGMGTFTNENNPECSKGKK